MDNIEFLRQVQVHYPPTKKQQAVEKEPPNTIFSMSRISYFIGLLIILCKWTCPYYAQNMKISGSNFPVF
jgi:hypothetical protein